MRHAFRERLCALFSGCLVVRFVFGGVFVGFVCVVVCVCVFFRGWVFFSVRFSCWLLSFWIVFGVLLCRRVGGRPLFCLLFVFWEFICGCVCVLMVVPLFLSYVCQCFCVGMCLHCVFALCVLRFVLALCVFTLCVFASVLH